MPRLLVALILAGSAASGVLLPAQTATPFKLGTFERQGRPFLGIVLRDAVIIDFAAANSAVGGRPIDAPADMKDLIARYNMGVRDRIVEIVRAVGTTRPAYVYDRTAVKTLPPIMYPTTMLNAAVNYREHAIEMAARDKRSGAAAAGTTSAASSAAGNAVPNTTSATGI